MANPLINGQRYSHTSVACTIDNYKYIRGLKEISYGVAVEPGEIYGSSRKPQGHTHGTAKYECSFKLYRQDADEMIAHMGAGFMSKYFDIQIEYGEKNAPVKVDSIAQVRIKGVKGSTSEGSADALVVEFETIVLGPIKIAGIDPILDASQEVMA